uniref:RdRp n=1 Tax=Beticola ourmia-like virus 1 TaxID=2973094 RepID=A0A976SHW6_9VIRU|nr:RdRp [Beticola ourmia-like virus 1]
MSSSGSSFQASTATAARGNSSSGSRAQTCRLCLRTERDTREAISNGLRLIRIRFGLPNSELPDLEPSRLGMFLSYLLLSGKERASVRFPRRQRQGVDGLCRLERLWRRERWEFAHSVSSLKRNLPSGCRLHSSSVRSAWEANAFSNPPPPSPDYLRFVRKEVSKLFRYGWDDRYDDFVWRHVPNPTARKTARRADEYWKGKGKEFRRQCLHGSRGLPRPMLARYKEVLSAGKLRPLLIYEERSEVLAPLHKTIYGHLMKTDWLLVGPPTEEKISSACAGSHQTSVDLVNATDNLSLVVTEAILGTLLRKSTRIPGSVKLVAYESLRPFVDGPNGMQEVSHGQMMGSYLSFPLLCIHSYLAALWALREREGTILVNGDDTLISSSSYIEASHYPSGYLLNDAKTIRSRTCAEINSTAFLKDGKGKWREIRSLRRGSFLTDYRGMLHAASACRRDVAWTDAFVRSRIGKKWGFLPSQLGLHPRSYPAFCRERSMENRYFTCLPEAPKEPSPLLRGLRRALDPDENLATVLHQWSYGREGGRKRDEFNPSVGFVRRSYGYRSIKLWSKLTFLGKLAGLKYRTREENKMCFLPADYTSMREDKVLRDHRRWTCLVEDENFK